MYIPKHLTARPPGPAPHSGHRLTWLSDFETHLRLSVLYGAIFFSETRLFNSFSLIPKMSAFESPVCRSSSQSVCAHRGGCHILFLAELFRTKMPRWQIPRPTRVGMVS